MQNRSVVTGGTCARCLEHTDRLLRSGKLALCESCASRAMANKKKVKKERKREGVQEGPIVLANKVENLAFANYYKSQLPELHAEWEAFEGCMRSPLPVTWRFSGFDERALALRASMEQVLLPTLEEQQPRPLPWYPDRLGWQSDLSRAALRGKDWNGADAPGAAGRSDAVRSFHSWLLRETELGRVQRQESVSMVPPLLLQLRPGLRVLDMCASPGSKTQVGRVAPRSLPSRTTASAGLLRARRVRTVRCSKSSRCSARLWRSRGQQDLRNRAQWRRAVRWSQTTLT